MAVENLICEKCQKENPGDWICQCPESLQSPRWMDRPNGPGLWLCDAGVGERIFPRIAAVELSENDIKHGAPFRTVAVFGPIPRLG